MRFPIISGGAIKFLNVAGAPTEGIVCQMPIAPRGSQMLVFPLRLAKEGVS